MSQVSTFVMFQGEAQRAIDLYSQVFERFRLMQVQHYDPTPDGRRKGGWKAADVDAVDLPEAPGVENVEDTVGGAADPSVPADLDAVDTGLVGAEVPDTDLTGGLL